MGRRALISPPRCLFLFYSTLVNSNVDRTEEKRTEQGTGGGLWRQIEPSGAMKRTYSPKLGNGASG